MASAIEKELTKATGVKPKDKEKRNDFLKRLLGKVGDLGDDEWKELSPAAQKWYNMAVKAFDKSEDNIVPDFDDAGGTEKATPKGKAKPAADDEDTDTAEDDADDSADKDDNETDGDAAEEPEAESEDTDVKTSKKPAAKPAAKKVAAKEKAPAAKKTTTKPAAKKAPVERVGVIDKLKDVLIDARDAKGGKPLNVAGIHAKLLKSFPDRGDAMLNTIRTQLSLLPGKGFAIKKEKTDDGVTYVAAKGAKK